MSETLSPVLSERIERLTKTLLDAADAADLMLATAESCTGGLLASLLTDIDGAGHVFDRGFVVYSERANASCSDWRRSRSTIAGRSVARWQWLWPRVR
jgi:nicotinamide-nucleotide amidase